MTKEGTLAGPYVEYSGYSAALKGRHHTFRIDSQNRLVPLMRLASLMQSGGLVGAQSESSFLKEGVWMGMVFINRGNYGRTSNFGGDSW